MRLIFVYNANAGIAAGIVDSIHKTVSPATYACSLCAITHGAFAMDKKWKAYLAQIDMPIAFYHRPDFKRTFPDRRGEVLPLIAIERNGEMEILIAADGLNAAASLDELMNTLDAALSQFADKR